jgi:hypothetical protein
MSIKKGKKTLERERQFLEFQERIAAEYIEVKCEIHNHYISHVRKDIEATCPLCKKDDIE